MTMKTVLTGALALLGCAALAAVTLENRNFRLLRRKRGRGKERR